ncbi:MAG TPA: DUF3341 domain-containing protein [Verrucomicrobiae bacterium]|jgi:hypothetical protein|nr:DUF3341 domain-containing protein [Verrucomicrobiae bacterium]
MAVAVFCIAMNEFQAETIVIELKNADFADDDISVLFPDKSGTKDFGHEQHTKAPEGALMGASALGILGGILGLLAGIGVLAKTGTSAFVTAGPAVAALAGIAVGAVVGAIIGAWIGMGVPEYVAKRYDGKIDAGNILISVHADSVRRAKRAKNIFVEADAQDIAMTGEAEVPEKRFGTRTEEAHPVLN